MQSPDGCFCLFHLLCGMPWSIWHVRQALPNLLPDTSVSTDMALGDTPLCVTLGAMFDTVRCPHNLLRGVTLRWVRWAGKSVLDICRAWGAEFALTHLGASLTGPSM